MIEFSKFVYLDLQKCASCHCTTLFRTYLREKPVYERRHEPTRQRYTPSKLHVISVRNPIDMYVSLYRYGLEEKGAVYLALKRQHMLHLYTPTIDGFSAWLNRIFDDPAKVDTDFNRVPHLSQLIGLATFRLARLSLQFPIRELAAVRSRDEFRKLLARRSIVHFAIRVEQLETDFGRFLRILEMLDCAMDQPIEAIEKQIGSLKRTNRSTMFPELKEMVSRRLDIEEKTLKREWFVVEQHGYTKTPNPIAKPRCADKIIDDRLDGRCDRR